MIRHLSHTDTDRKAWDDCIGESVNSRIYAYSWYLDEICADWEALVLGDYEAVMPLVYRKKWGIHYLFLPFSAQQLGVFSRTSVSEETLVSFLEAIPSRFRVIDLKLNDANSYSGKKFDVIPNRNYEVVMDRPFEDLFQEFSSNTKRNIKKAQKNGVNIGIDKTDHQEVIDLFKKTKGGQFPVLDERFYDTLDRLYTASKERGMAETRTVFAKDGSLLTTGLFLKDATRTFYILSGNTEAGRKLGGMHFLMNQVINSEAGSGRILDFEGSNDPQLARFYKGFGARESVYLQIRKNRLPLLFRPFFR